MIDNEFFQKMRAQAAADEMAKDSTKVDSSMVIPGVNAPSLRDGEDAIKEYCEQQGITVEEFYEIPAYKRKK